MREHKRKEDGAQRVSGAQNVDVTQLMGDVDDNSLKEELETCKHFLLYNRMQNGRQSQQLCRVYSGHDISVGKVRCCVSV